MDLEASESAIRAAMHELGGRLLERVLNADKGAYRGSRIDCGGGHQAEFVGYREKRLQTVLCKIRLQRAYYHCGLCQAGVIPKDVELDVAGTGFSPGVRRMMGRVGAKEAFDEGRRDLKELAGLVVKTKAVERISQAIGSQAERVFQGERRAALSGKLAGVEAVPTLYIAIDGTGVPVVARESEGRKA